MRAAQGLKPAAIWLVLRGPEGPLFHGAYKGLSSALLTTAALASCSQRTRVDRAVLITQPGYRCATLLNIHSELKLK
jgi:hypothetical protein